MLVVIWSSRYDLNDEFNHGAPAEHPWLGRGVLLHDQLGGRQPLLQLPQLVPPVEGDRDLLEVAGLLLEAGGAGLARHLGRLGGRLGGHLGGHGEGHLGTRITRGTMAFTCVDSFNDKVLYQKVF